MLLEITDDFSDMEDQDHGFETEYVLSRVKFKAEFCIPDWVRYITVDSNGAVYGWCKKPVIRTYGYGSPLKVWGLRGYRWVDDPESYELLVPGGSKWSVPDWKKQIQEMNVD